MSAFAQGSSAPTSSTIEVAVRVRPFLPKETQCASDGTPIESIVHCLTDSVVVDPGRAKRHNTSRYYGMRGQTKAAKRFNFDAVYGPRSTQEEVYSGLIRKVALETFNGKNGSVLAYGATGSGKTHTMIGDMDSAQSGVVFQVMADMLQQKAALECMGKKVNIKVAHYEVYNELVYDLLVHHPRGGEKRVILQVQETADGAAELPHLSWHHPSSLAEFSDLMSRSIASRAVAETVANEVSSRSHAILTLEVEVRPDEQADVGTVARLKLCDLAGSERAASNLNKGKTFKEGANINKSLLALGTVVQALAVARPDAVHPLSRLQADSTLEGLLRWQLQYSDDGVRHTSSQVAG